jgi:hypothetical protein
VQTSYNPIAQPFGGPQIPGNPGSFWGPGSTYYASQQGSSLPPEIINQQGNAYLYGPGGWEAAGVNAQAPSQGPAPTPGYAGPNSIPGQQLTPFFGPQQQADLLAQLQPALAGLHKPNQQRSVLDTQLGNFFSNMAPTSDLGAPRGGYVPGYAVPQASLDYIPTGAEFGLENAILNRQKGPGSLRNAISSWASGLGSQAGPPGFTVPSPQQQGGGK